MSWVSCRNVMSSVKCYDPEFSNSWWLELGVRDMDGTVLLENGFDNLKN